MTMRRSSIPRVVLALVVLIPAGDPCIAFAVDDAEPTYGGKRLSEWVKGLDSDDFSAQEATQAALRRVDVKEIPALIAALKSEEEAIRRGTIKVLGAIGPKAAGA